MSRATMERAAKSHTLTISSGQTTSNAVHIGEDEFNGLLGSTAFSSTQITFEVANSSDSAIWSQACDRAGTALTVTVSTNSAKAYTDSTIHTVLKPYPWLRIVSGSTGEAAARTLTLMCK